MVSILPDLGDVDVIKLVGDRDHSLVKAIIARLVTANKRIG